MTIDDRLKAARVETRALLQELQALLQTDKSRRRGRINREIHALRHAMDTNYLYRSQAGQDAIVDQLANRKIGGTFVDIGGYDGVTGSNSLFFEQIRGWTGILVEPVGSQIDKARVARKCDCLQYAVAPEDGTARFIAVTQGYTQMSGLASSYDEKLLETVRNDPRHKEEIVEVETRTLSRLLIEAGIEHPDFISLDIEGGELDVLRNFPFDSHNVTFWAIENNTGNTEIASIMRENGYELVEFAGQDEIYQLKNR